MKHDSWENALFVHWPVDPAELAKLLPRGLEPDILDGSAWVGLVLLTERGVSGHGSLQRRLVAPIDHYGANVRTYVSHNGVPGIFFFSLECTSILASFGARMAGIPYFPARMWRCVDVEKPLGVGGGKIGCFQQLKPPLPVVTTESIICDQQNPQDGGEFAFEFSSVRVGGLWGKRPSVTARWKIGSVNAGTRDEAFLERGRWFTERYSVYSAWPAGRGSILLRGDVQHPPWTLQPASLEALDAESLLTAAGLPGLASGPNAAKAHVCFSRGVGPVDFWMLEPV